VKFMFGDQLMLVPQADDKVIIKIKLKIVCVRSEDIFWRNCLGRAWVIAIRFHAW
jgi:hypothetical protein